MKISIVGNGAWGKAMYSLVNDKGYFVQLLGKGEASDNNDLVILSVPTQDIRTALDQVSFANKKVIVNTAKGVERSTHLFPYEIVRDTLEGNYEYYSLIGPSFAGEVVKNMPTLVNLGYIDEYSSIDTIRTAIQTKHFRVKTVRGVEMLELSGALKNIYAIVCGMADGYGYGSNTRVKLIVLAIEEIKRLSAALNISDFPTAIAGTVGDLILTCNSEESRNFRFGKYITLLSVEKSLMEVNATVEGYHTLESIQYFEDKSGVDLPLAQFISDSIDRDDPNTLHENLQSFLSKV